MRLIDADALKREITKYHAGLKPRYISKLVDAEIADIQDIIDETQTVDAELVRHGRWVENGKEYSIRVMCDRCSICGSTQGIDWMNYCPHCGAKMDAREEQQ